ncbi:putative DNA methylase [alpha proteobacterium U9-1i]|nr:putative DNA methylase [alpha proteobacterium U9-1i]
MSLQLARAMRRKMTDAEMRLWFRLRPLRRDGLAFRRQAPVGRYILDFECRPAKLGIELDGVRHTDADAQAYDAERTAWFEMRGYQILRFWNQDVLQQTDNVVDHIIKVAASRLPSST